MRQSSTLTSRYPFGWALLGRATLAVGVSVPLLATPALAAEPEVSVGGYHDAALRAAQNEWLGINLGMAGDPSTGPRPIVAQPDGPSALTSFTPRFGGLGLGIASGRHQEFGSALLGATAPDRSQGLEVGLKNTSKIAGMALDWSAKASVGREPPAQPGDGSSLVVGGELAISGVRFDAAYGEHATVLGVSGNRMTAGVAYGIGPVDTRISYSLVSASDETEASLLTVGSQLTLQPGLILQGNLAYAEQQSTGDAATAGVVSLRFNF
jgi:Gram-negative porin